MAAEMRAVHGIAFRGMQEKYDANMQKGVILPKAGRKNEEGQPTRAEKLATAMRANLRKRKQQQRERMASAQESDEKPDETGKGDG